MAVYRRTKEIEDNVVYPEVYAEDEDKTKVNGWAKCAFPVRNIDGNVNSIFCGVILHVSTNALSDYIDSVPSVHEVFLLDDEDNTPSWCEVLGFDLPVEVNEPLYAVDVENVCSLSFKYTDGGDCYETICRPLDDKPVLLRYLVKKDAMDLIKTHQMVLKY